MANQQKSYPTFIDFRKGENNAAPFGAIIANTTRDIELRYTNTGKAVASTGLAVNLGAKHINYVLGTNYGDDEIIFIEATGWEKTGEMMANANIPKGSQVAFTGSLSLEEYNGKNRIRLNVSRFQVIRRKGDNGQSASTPTKQSDVVADDLPF